MLFRKACAVNCCNQAISLIEDFEHYRDVEIVTRKLVSHTLISGRQPSLKTLLTGAPERPVLGKNYVAASLTNLASILQHSHHFEYGARSTIRAARHFALFAHRHQSGFSC